MNIEFKGFGLAKKDDNVTQHRERYVGGSDVPTILGINKYKTQYELAKEKTGLVEKPFISNEYTDYGNKMEPQIRNYINAVNQTHFIVDTVINEDQHIRSNVDGVDYKEGILLEIKTHGKNYNQLVYEAQMQLYMAQLNLKIGWLAMYERPANFDVEFNSDHLKIVEVERDEDFIRKIYDAIETFWIRCEFLKEKPEMDETEYMTIGTDMDIAIVKLNRVAPKLLALKEQAEELKKIEEDAKALLYQKMTENDIKKIETPFLTVTRVLPSKALKFDSKRFKAEHEELYSEYLKESERKGFVTFKGVKHD